MTRVREKFATQVNSQTLAEIRGIPQSEGRQIPALTDLAEKRKNTRPRAHVMAAYLASHEKYSELYQKLAK